MSSIGPAHLRRAQRVLFAEAAAELRLVNDHVFNDVIAAVDLMIERCDGTVSLESLNKRRDELVRANIAVDAVIDRIDPGKAPSWP
jgi:hypothetical protein